MSSCVDSPKSIDYMLHSWSSHYQLKYKFHFTFQEYRTVVSLGPFQTSCYCRSELARLQHYCSTTEFQTSNLTESNKIALAENKTEKYYKKRLSELEFCTAVARSLKPSRAYCRVARQSVRWYTAVSSNWFQTSRYRCAELQFTAERAVLHSSSTTWFQTSHYCRAKVEFNSINCAGYAVARRLKQAQFSPLSVSVFKEAVSRLTSYWVNTAYNKYNVSYFHYEA